MFYSEKDVMKPIEQGLSMMLQIQTHVQTDKTERYMQCRQAFAKLWGAELLHAQEACSKLYAVRRVQQLVTAADLLKRDIMNDKAQLRCGDS